MAFRDDYLDEIPVVGEILEQKNDFMVRECVYELMPSYWPKVEFDLVKSCTLP
jgi:hypothetical protein